MDAHEFIKLLENPELVSQKSVEELKNLSLQYPYSQPVQLLYTMRLSQSSEYLFSRQLGKTSILTCDRSVLFDLFEREGEELPAAEPTPDKDLLAARLEKNLEPANADGTEEQPTTSESTLTSPREEEEPKAEAQEPTQDAPESSPPLAEEEKPVAEKSDNTQVPPASQEALTAKERIQAILDENRRLREQYQGGKKESTEVDQRIAGIKERLEKIKKSKGEHPPAAAPAREESAPTAGQNEVASQFEKTEDHQPPQSPDVPENIPSEEAVTPAEENNIEEEALIELNRADEEPPVMDLVDLDDDEVDNKATTVPGTTESEHEQEPGEDQEADPSGPVDQPVEVPEMDTLFTIEDEDEPVAPDEVADKENYSSEAHSFSGWLKRLQDKRQRVEKPGQSAGSNRGEEEKNAPPDDMDTKLQLLDSFVEKLPELKKKPKKSSGQVTASKDDEEEGLNEEESSLVTETLARVYVKQKHYDKAIKAYEILRLKYPEKSSFFADRISEIKKMINR